MNLQNWFMGVVEDDSDPEERGRVKVRCFGYHTPDHTLLPTKDLPYVQTIHPVTAGPGAGGSGESPSPLLNSIVFGVFYDGDDMQDALILGVLPGGNLPNAQFDPATNFGFGTAAPIGGGGGGSATPRAGGAPPAVTRPITKATVGNGGRSPFRSKEPEYPGQGESTPVIGGGSGGIGSEFAKNASVGSGLSSATQKISEAVERIIPSNIGILKATTHGGAGYDRVTAGEVADGTMERVGGDPARASSGVLYRGLESDIPTVAINPNTFKKLYNLPAGTSFAEAKRIMHETQPIIFVESNLFPQGKLFQIAGSGPASERLDFFSSNQEQFDFLKTQFGGLTSISVVPPELFKEAMGNYKLGAKDSFFGTVEKSIGEISQQIIDQGVYTNELEQPIDIFEGGGPPIETAEEFHEWATSRGFGGITVNSGSGHNIQEGTILINKSMFGGEGESQKALIVVSPQQLAGWDDINWGEWYSYNLGSTGGKPAEGLPESEILPENTEEPTEPEYFEGGDPRGLPEGGPGSEPSSGLFPAGLFPQQDSQFTHQQNLQFYGPAGTPENSGPTQITPNPQAGF